MDDRRDPAVPEEHVDIGVLELELQHALRDTLFSSGLMISPARVRQISAEMATSFFSFFDGRQDVETRNIGAQLANDGLGSASLLAMTEALRRTCREKSNPLSDLPNTAGQYCNAVTEGYIEAREENLLKEQERTYQAFLRAKESRALGSG
ncbi:MAG: hypothetical protein U9R25_17125 [Chloroflexota bacterium]|nr:hypothetical protein [Chloroflexota bacterium]